MSETDDTTPEPTAETAPADEPDQQYDDPVAAAASRASAKWRNKFRDAETRITQLAERVTTMQRAEAERIATKALQDGSDIWRGGIELAHLLDDNGDLDPAKVSDTATKLADTHRHWRRTVPAAAPTAGVGTGKISDARPEPSFADAFKPRSG